MTEKEKVKPVHRVNCGLVQAAVWKNVIKKDGETIDVFNVTIQKNYKDGDEWKTSGSFGLNDLPRAVVAFQKAYEYLVIKDNKDKEETTTPE